MSNEEVTYHLSYHEAGLLIAMARDAAQGISYDSEGKKKFVFQFAGKMEDQYKDQALPGSQASGLLHDLNQP